jgi:hypothetical protein
MFSSNFREGVELANRHVIYGSGQLKMSAANIKTQARHLSQ